MEVTLYTKVQHQRDDATDNDNTIVKNIKKNVTEFRINTPLHGEDTHCPTPMP